MSNREVRLLGSMTDLSPAVDVRGEDEGVVQDPLHGGPGLGSPVPELVANFIFLSWKVLCSDFLLLPEEGKVTIEVNTLRVESGSGSGKR